MGGETDRTVRLLAANCLAPQETTAMQGVWSSARKS